MCAYVYLKVEYRTLYTETCQHTRNNRRRGFPPKILYSWKVKLYEPHTPLTHLTSETCKLLLSPAAQIKPSGQAINRRAAPYTYLAEARRCFLRELDGFLCSVRSSSLSIAAVRCAFKTTLSLSAASLGSGTYVCGPPTPVSYDLCCVVVHGHLNKPRNR
jgi:hypothetical protein